MPEPTPLISTPATSDRVAGLCAAARQAAGSFLGPRGLNRMELALAEFFNNIVLHGMSQAGVTISVSFSHDKAGFMVIVHDTCTTPTPTPTTAMPDPADLATGGYGLPLIGQCVDDWATHHSATGNRTVLTFRPRTAEAQKETS